MRIRLFIILLVVQASAFQTSRNGGRRFKLLRKRPSFAVSSLQRNIMGNEPAALLPTKRFVNHAQEALQKQQTVAFAAETEEDNQELDDDATILNRRLFFGAALLGTAATIRPRAAVANSSFGKLEWESTPVNKRTGVTVFDAEKAGFNVRFVTYLSRFLLVFDIDCQKWWYARAADIPRRASAKEVEQVRLAQFGAFSASVEVGLQEYRGKDGPQKLMEALLYRYCPDLDTVRYKRESRTLSPLTDEQEIKEQREIKEARRQIALLFGLMETNQPVDAITKVLAAIDNGCVKSVRVEDGGGGYAPGYGSPLVEFPPPKAGDDFKKATGRATLTPNGKILRFDLENRGFGYKSPPNIIISPPGADRGIVIPDGQAATAKAFLFKNGVNKGRLSRIELTNGGDGYMEGEKIRVLLSPPELPLEEGGLQATAKAVLELQVSSIEITNGGSGYAIEKPMLIYVEAPPLTARINMNDPLEARIIDPREPLPMSNAANAKIRQEIPLYSDPKSLTSVVTKIARNDGNGGGGGCIGRACYDKPVVAYGVAQAETSSFSEFRTEADALGPVESEEELLQKRIIQGTSAGLDSQLKVPAFWNGGPSSSSAQLLTLIPAGLGLEYDAKLGRYVLTAGKDFIDINEKNLLGASNRPLDPEFGPRGRSPIERDVTLNLPSFLRFCLSGAICASGVHFILTPLDVVKTKIQTDPKNYPGVVSAFRKVAGDRGIGGFFDGWAPTFVGFFCWGSASYSTTELLRRYFNDYLGADAIGLEVPVILMSSAIGAALSTFILCPFESVRIRSVSQPDYGGNLIDVTGRMIKDEGLGSLFSAIPPMLFKEVPFNTAKFLIFSLVTKLLYDNFPAAQEDIQLSLVISLVGGMTGGLVAAIVSNPADATISEMKKTSAKVGPVDAVKGLIKRGGYANLMRGLPIRMAFYPLIVSMQFFVFDSIRLYLGIGSDDLKLYLDVLGGALKDGGSMVGPT